MMLHEKKCPADLVNHPQILPRIPILPNPSKEVRHNPFEVRCTTGLAADLEKRQELSAGMPDRDFS